MAGIGSGNFLQTLKNKSAHAEKYFYMLNTKYDKAYPHWVKF
jgi:hypothetical protein